MQRNITVDQKAPVEVVYQDGLLNGIDMLTTNGVSTRRQLNSDQLLTTPQAVKAIPYYAWANRGKGEMTVWFPAKITDVDLITQKMEEKIVAK